MPPMPPAPALAAAEAGAAGEGGFGALAAFVAGNVVGANMTAPSAYGGRTPIVYTDYTASGRALASVEAYITDEVLPLYANTHTATTVTGLQTTRFREEARDIIRNATNASEHDAVVFCGSGVTGAVHRLVHALRVRAAVAAGSKVVVLTGPMEHHSSFLPWCDAGARVLRVRRCAASGRTCRRHLAALLAGAEVRGAALAVGVFSAASNVTGFVEDVDGVTNALHAAGVLSVWDYATAGPYLPIDLNPPGAAPKDAVLLSPHKFVGGVGSPGVLVAKKSVFRNATPWAGGGGSVFFVSAQGHRYLQDVEAREEGGTPNIVGAVRAGLAFRLKADATAAAIMAREEELVARANAVLESCPGLRLLGRAGSAGTAGGSTTRSAFCSQGLDAVRNPNGESASATADEVSTAANQLPQLAIFSFAVLHPASGRYLHHNAVVALLNDLFGIQARGGCACAGPYAQELLGMTDEQVAGYEALLLEDARLDRAHLRRRGEHSPREVLRPGFSRLNLPWFMPDDKVNFVLAALAFVAEHGWKLLPLYRLNTETGEWRHTHHTMFKERRWLGHVSFRGGSMTYKEAGEGKDSKGNVLDYGTMLQRAHEAAAAVAHTSEPGLPWMQVLDDEAETHRWFLYPKEALWWLQNPQATAESQGVARAPFNVPEDAALATRCVCARNNANGEVLLTEEMMVTKDRSEDGMCTTTAAHITTSTTMASNAESAGSGTSDPSPAAVVVAKDKVTSEVDALRAEVAALKAALAETQRIDRSSSSVAAGASPSNPPPVACPLLPRPRKAPATRASQSAASGPRFHLPPKSILMATRRAMQDFNMIQDGDRILVGVSGGKDSLTLLHVLHQLRYTFRALGISFEFGAATVDPGTDSYDPSSLKEYMSALGIPYFYEEQCIMDAAGRLTDLASICSFCSRMKRGRLYACARREGYNVLMYGHHLDDLAETLFMSAFHNGYLNTMKVHYTVKEGDLRMARPFAYVRERDIRAFAERADVRLPIISENCPACFEAPTERARVKQLLAAQELLYPHLFQSLARAMRPLMAQQREKGVDGAGSTHGAAAGGKGPRTTFSKATAAESEQEE